MSLNPRRIRLERRKLKYVIYLSSREYADFVFRNQPPIFSERKGTRLKSLNLTRPLDRLSRNICARPRITRIRGNLTMFIRIFTLPLTANILLDRRNILTTARRLFTSLLTNFEKYKLKTRKKPRR